MAKYFTEEKLLYPAQSLLETLATPLPKSLWKTNPNFWKASGSTPKHKRSEKTR